jgi:hypothetical protein
LNGVDVTFRRRTTDAVRWVTLPFTDEPLEAVVHFGSGKDADLELKFADGRRVKLPAGTVRVAVDGRVVIEATRWDDVSLHIEYRGPGRCLHSAQIGLPGEDADFVAMAESWLAAGCHDELPCVVEAQLHLTSGPPDPTVVG